MPKLLLVEILTYDGKHTMLNKTMLKRFTLLQLVML